MQLGRFGLEFCGQLGLPRQPCGRGDGTYQFTWDDLIHRYVGGGGSDMDLQMGMTIPGVTLKSLRCPANRIEFPKAET